MATEGQHRHPAGEAFYDLIVALLLARRRLDESAPLGIAEETRDDWCVLRALVADGPQSLDELADTGPLPRQRVEAAVIGLEREAFVHRNGGPAAAGETLLEISAAGEKRFAEIEAVLVAAMDDLSTGFDPGALATAARVVGEVSARFAEANDEN
ncbi:MAG: hypothetical protein RLO50_20320 [Azospirillaceae bacterium]